MLNETGGTENAGDGGEKKLEADVQDTVERGEEIQENVRRLTLMALAAETPNPELLRRTISAVVRGASEGIQRQLKETTAQAQDARARISQATVGLDSALAQFAEASKLAVEEAAGHARKFSDEDLVQIRSDLESVEGLFMEILRGSASTAQSQAGDALRDLAQHFERSGTAVGRQINETVETIGRQMTAAGLTPFESGVRLAHVTSDLMRKIAAGVLTAVADRVNPDDGSGKSDK
jgi:hypothetical protein